MFSLPRCDVTISRVLALCLLASTAFGCRDQPPVAAPPVRLSLPVQEGVDAGPLDAAIAPDESSIVFVATSRGTTQLWRREFVDEDARPLAGTEGARMPAWKQTGSVVSFFGGERLKYLALGDGSIGDLAAAGSPGGATWLLDGSLLFAPDSSGPVRRLFEGRLTDATTLAAGDAGHVFPMARGASDEFIYIAIRTDGRRVVRLVTGDGQHDLTTTSAHAVLVNDLLLHVEDNVLLAYRFDAETTRLTGRGIPVTLDSGISDSSRGLFAASPRVLVHSREATRSRELAWVGRDGDPMGAIGDAGDHWQVRLSPDDRFVAVTTLDPLLRSLDVFTVPTGTTGTAERLTLSLAADSDPVWSPDGTRVLFRSMQDGVANLYARRARTRGAPDEPILTSPLDETPTEWRTDGEILFHARGGDTLDMFRLALPAGSSEPVVQSAFNESDARRSPDGRWLSYVSDESAQPDVYVQDASARRQRVSFGGGMKPRWSRDGRTLYFLRGSRLMRATLAADGRTFTNAQVAFEMPGIVDFDAAHRSDRFVVARDVRSVAETPVNVILNWRTIVEQGKGE